MKQIRQIIDAIQSFQDFITSLTEDGNRLKTNSRDFLTKELIDGGFWSTGFYFDDVDQTQTKKVVLENPENSGKYLFVVEPTVRSQGQIQVEKAFNVNIDAEGQSLDIVNKNSQYLDSAIASAQLGGDNETGSFSGGTEFNDKQAGSGTNMSNQSPGVSTPSGVSNIVDEGDNILIGFTNRSGVNNTRSSIDIDFVIRDKT